MRVMVRLWMAVLVAFSGAAAAAAQQSWVQIEAQPGPALGATAARGYARQLEDVEGFRLGATEWYAVVLGPYGPDEAARKRADLRARGLIPSDSFISDGAAFRARFWPPEGQRAAPQPTEEVATPPTPAEETIAEARAAEAALDRAARRQLQTALQWEGVYDAGIDGAFGRGTRAAMRAWQAREGYEVTGVLTTRQRADLIANYNAILDGLGMEPVTDDTAGITVEMPTALVAFDRYAAPFAHYGPTGDGPHKVLLISQRGDRATLHALYDVLQTLEIVPKDGEREKRDDGFTLTGRGGGIVSRTEAWLTGGQIKGFTLIWPEDDERRRDRVVQAMRASFAVDPETVMDDDAGQAGEDQRVDLLAGLQIRQPLRQRSGFYIDRRGAVLTTAAAVADCGRIVLDGGTEARVATRDDVAGLALLTPARSLAPRVWGRLQARVPRLGDDVVLSGYSFEGALGAPSLTYGRLADLRGIGGDEAVKRFELAAEPGDTGGPILDLSGAVLGMLVPADAPGGRDLPDGAAFGADVDTIAAFLDGTEAEPDTTPRGPALPRARLTAQASEMTVLVSCWE